MKKLIIGALCSAALSLSALAGQPHHQRQGHINQHSNVHVNQHSNFHGNVNYNRNRNYSNRNRTYTSRSGVRWSSGRTFRNGRWFFRSGGYGWHDRVWWINSGYTIIFFDGCYYYYADGCYYPAYGYVADCYFDD